MKKWKMGLKWGFVLLLTAALVGNTIDFFALSVSAETAGQTEKPSAVITSFEELSESVREQMLSIGAEESDIIFPDTLTITVEKIVPKEETEKVSDDGQETEESDESMEEDTYGLEEETGESEQSQSDEDTQELEEPEQTTVFSEETESETETEPEADQTSAADDNLIGKIADVLLPEPLIVYAAEAGEDTVSDGNAEKGTDGQIITEEITLENITWELDTENSAADTFLSDEAANGYFYTYVPVMPDTVTLTDGEEEEQDYALELGADVELPEIYVLVGENGIMLMSTSTLISTDRNEGIAQIQEVIPDYNFAAAVYDAFFAEEYFGNANQSLTDVLAAFDGEIYAGENKRKNFYIVTAVKVDSSTYESESINKEFDDYSAAEYFYRSLINTSEYFYINKTFIAETRVVDELKDDEDMICDITGIEWLRNAQSIDISYNKITDLSPLDIDHLNELAAQTGDTTTDNGEKWFGSAGKNVYIDFRGNPIQKYPAAAGGRLNLPGLEDTEFQAEAEPYVFVKEDNEISALDINIPLIEREGERINIKGVNVVYSDIDGAYLETESVSKEAVSVLGADHSGMIQLGIEGADDSAIVSYAASASDDITAVSSTFKFLLNQPVRVYYPVQTITSNNNANITLETTTENDTVPIENAAYRLYKAKIADNSYVKGELYSDTYYFTDENGKITIEETLPSGDYCLVEEEVPEKYVLDDTPIGFRIGVTVSLTGGTKQITTSEGTYVESGENMTYIDRYSPEASLTVVPEEGKTVKKIVITYFDRTAQDYVTVEFDGDNAVSSAEEWINTNKGDDAGPGIIDGSVTVGAVFNTSVGLKATNQLKANDLKVTKIVEGCAADTTQDFEFTVTLGQQMDGTAVNGEYGDMTFVDGVAEFTLRDGESKTAGGLPVGVSYTVEEKGMENYTVTSTGAKGIIAANTTVEAVITNTIIPGNLTVMKKVEGEGADLTREFHFTVTLGKLSDGTAVNGEYGDMTFVDGVAEFALRDGESKTAGGLPVGVSYAVEEERADGYTAASTGETGMIIANTTMTVVYTNFKDMEEPGTEEPGTEEPGTEEPGTEEPSTEEPGTEDTGTEDCYHTHTELRNAKAAACKETGYTGDTYCADCGTKTKTGTETPALGHNYTSKVTTEPTTDREGVRTYTCTNCGHSYTIPIEKLQDTSDNQPENKQPRDNHPGDSNSGSDVAEENRPDTGKPFIKNDAEKEGWDVIRDVVEKAKDGETITVDMNGVTVVPGDVFNNIKGRDITIVFHMGDGVTWSVNGQSITADKVGDIDFSVRTGTNTIPVDVISNVTGECFQLQISLAYDGEFGFTAVLSINMDKKNAELYANLFYYNEASGKLESICADEISANGTAELTFTHASDYAIVFPLQNFPL